MEEDMRKVNVPEWYIESCGKIKYMFPKAHAAAYVTAAIRVGWYKVYKPIEFYCAYFTARPDDVDVETVLKGKEAVKNYIRNIRLKGKEASKKELDVCENMLIFNVMFERGLEILPIDLNKSHARKFLVEDGKMRLPFGALSGVGGKAADALYEAAQSGNFLSKQEFQAQAGVSKTIIETLSDMGVFNDLPETNQMTLF
jgi:DNA polymerase-3 subunit alpha (Gram-positive type)